MRTREKQNIVWNAGNAVYAGMSLLHSVDFEGRDALKEKLFECWEELSEVASGFSDQYMEELNKMFGLQEASND